MAHQIALAIEYHSLLATMRNQVQNLQERVESSEPSIVGTGQRIKRVVDLARKAADSNATILILGESGTGKEVLARSIHRWSQRRESPFVVVNCAALSDQLLQSDLFGHERGAFTGAVRQKRGRLELADGGTVFLDEIGEVDPELQGKLLRFLQEREFERVGGTKAIRVDVRIIAATNRDLHAEVRERRFREDLFYRLRVVELTMPPLRERRNDIPALAETFLREYVGEAGRRPLHLSPEAREALSAYDWPGNVRELRNAIERAVVLSSGDVIGAGEFDFRHRQQTIHLDESLTGYHQQIHQLKRQVIQNALDQSDGNQTLAADRLGIQRSYLSRLMRNLGMR